MQHSKPLLPACPSEESSDGVSGKGDDEPGEDHHASDQREHVQVDVHAGLKHLDVQYLTPLASLGEWITKYSLHFCKILCAKE